MKDQTARELMRRMTEEEAPMPLWQRVTMRAEFEQHVAARRAPFGALHRVQLAVYVVVGLALGGLALWAAVAWFS